MPDSNSPLPLGLQIPDLNAIETRLEPALREAYDGLDARPPRVGSGLILAVLESVVAEMEAQGYRVILQYPGGRTTLLIEKFQE